MHKHVDKVNVHTKTCVIQSSSTSGNYEIHRRTKSKILAASEYSSSRVKCIWTVIYNKLRIVQTEEERHPWLNCCTTKSVCGFKLRYLAIYLHTQNIS